MKIIKFVNFTNEDFTGGWNGQYKLVKAGQSLYMADYLAFHFAKHLVNRELTKKGLHNFTSPKKPEEVPQFMELFNKCVIVDEHAGDMGDMDIMDVQPVRKHVEEDPRQAAKRGGAVTIASGPQDPDLKDADDEDNFEGKKEEVTKDAAKAEGAGDQTKTE